MPPILPTANLPTFAVAGQHRPEIDAGLQRLLVTERSPGRALCEFELGNWGVASDGTMGSLWSDGRLLQIGATVAVRWGTETLFEGNVVAMEGRWPAGSAPTLVLRCSGKRPAGAQPGTVPQLRWGAELVRLEAHVESTGRGRPRPGSPHRTAVRARGEATSVAGVGSTAMRAAGEVDLLAVGAVFEGRYTIDDVTIRFDPDQGLHVEFSATRGSGQGRVA